MSTLHRRDSEAAGLAGASRTHHHPVRIGVDD